LPRLPGQRASCDRSGTAWNWADVVEAASERLSQMGRGGRRVQAAAAAAV